MSNWTRRQFLQRAAASLAAAQLARWWPGGLTGSPIPVTRAQSFPLAAAAVGTNEDSPEDLLTTALDGIGGIGRFVQPGQTVAIKPNATWAYPPHTASSTDPEFLKAVIRAVKNAGASRIIVMDHCSIDPGTAEAVRVNGLAQAVKDEDVEGLFPDRNNAPLSTYEKIEFKQGKAFQQLGVIKAAIEADVRINLGVAKTHNVTKVTMCLKHMMGFLQVPGRLHSSLDQGIADLSTPSPLQAHLHILEAIRVRLPYGNYRVCAGPETDLTNPNVVQRANQIIAGTDPLLIDVYGCTSFFDMLAEELPYLQRAFESGVGLIDLEAARQSGQFVILPVGQPLPSPTPTLPEPTAPDSGSTPTPAPQAPAGTSTPLPTATPMPGGNLPVGIHASAPQDCATSPVIDPRPFLNPALLPAAAVVAGAGLVAAGRSRKKRKQAEHDVPRGEHDEKR